MAVNSLRALKADAFDYWKAQHLLNRAGFGGTPAQVRALANLGLDKAVEHIVEYQKETWEEVKGDEFDKDIVRPANAEESAAARRARQSGDEAAVEQLRQQVQARQAADRRQIRAMQLWWMERMIETPRPLEEKLTLFWHGHFATGYRAIEDSFHMFLQNQFFRQNAAGNFADMVYGIVRDPAMLKFLNNNQNRKQAPNENLARELMELFTLGEGNDYTESDIKEAARALTGNTYEDNEFVFQQNQHDEGSKRILGQTGKFDGTDLCRIILSRTTVSEYICHKLYRYFVNDMPGLPDKDAQGFILKLARTMRDANYDVKPVLHTLFRSEHFYDEANVACQIKSPVQIVVQTVRSLRTPVRSLSALVSAADLMGQNLFFPPSVKGWDGGRAWINTSTLFVRQNLIIYLLTGRRPDAYEWDADGSKFDASHLIEHLQSASGNEGGGDVKSTVMYLLRFALGSEPHADRVETLETYVKDAGGRMTNDVLIGLLSLIAAMPEYQLC